MSDIPKITLDDTSATTPAKEPSTVGTSIISLQNPEVLQAVDQK